MTSTPVWPATTALADVLQLRGRTGWLSPPLVPAWRGSRALAGQARTVQFAPGPGPDGLKPLHRLLGQDLTDSVIVLAGAGCAPGAVWGEILTMAARSAGALAVVVEGSVRDAPSFADLGLPVWSSGEATAGPGGQVHVCGMGAPVTIAAVPVSEGDLVVLDPSGVVSLPSKDADRVCSEALRYTVAEEAVVAALAEGQALGQAYRHKGAMLEELYAGWSQTAPRSSSSSRVPLPVQPRPGSTPDGGLLAQLLDRSAIQELCARNNRAFDDGDAEGFAATFVADGELIVDARVVARGSQQLADFCRRIGFGTVHVTADPVIEVDGDRATHVCTLLLFRRFDDRRAATLTTTGRYTDGLRRTDAEWRFVRRTANFDVSLLEIGPRS